MNINHIHPAYLQPQPGVRPAGSRFDVTLAEPAAPAGPGAKSEQAPQIGSIRGVLSPEENRAIAEIFSARSSGLYGAGGNVSQTAVPGLHLDLRA